MRRPEHERGRPADNRTASASVGGDLKLSPSIRRQTPGALELAAGLDFDHVARRVIADALLEATSSWWTARALDFERARSRPGDYLGGASAADIAAADARLSSTAAACRARAQLAPLQTDVIDEVVAS